MVETHKYPRTPHLPSSNPSSDDKIASLDTISYLKSGIELVVTEKMDGGNLTLYPDAFHARSMDSGTHLWDTRAKAIWSNIRFDIPTGYRVSCESLYARRSVAYENLLNPLYVIGVWDDTNILLSFDDCAEFAELLGLPIVPLIYRGNNYDDAVKAWSTKFTPEISEGFVMRDAGRITYSEFGNKVAKYVRENHVTTDASWRGRDDFDVNTFIN